MTACVSLSPLRSPPLLSLPSSVFSQQQIFICQFTRGLCSPGYQQPRSFSAESRWFPGCTPPHSPPVKAAKNISHTLSSVHCIISQLCLFCKWPVLQLKVTSVLPRFSPFWGHFKRLGWRKRGAWAGRTFRTKVLSLSGISSGMVVLTSTIAERGMLTLGFEH